MMRGVLSSFLSYLRKKTGIVKIITIQLLTNIYGLKVEHMSCRLHDTHMS